MLESRNISLLPNKKSSEKNEDKTRRSFFPRSIGSPVRSFSITRQSAQKSRGGQRSRKKRWTCTVHSFRNQKRSLPWEKLGEAPPLRSSRVEICIQGVSLLVVPRCDVFRGASRYSQVSAGYAHVHRVKVALKAEGREALARDID